MAEAPAPKQIRNTMYDKMSFPEYEHREFPMAVPVVNGVVQLNDKGEFQPYNERRKAHPVVIVKSQAELEALRGGEVELVPVNPDAADTASRLESEEDVREELYVRADQAGVKFDKRWSIERIERAIADAKAESKPVV